MGGAHSLENTAVERIFAERKDFIIIGLTGRTGCGCTTVAKLLGQAFDNMQAPVPCNDESIEGREYRILYEYVKNAWIPFRLIEMKHIIFTFILEHDFKTTTDFLRGIARDTGDTIDLSQYIGTYTELYEKRLKWKSETKEQNEKGNGVPSNDEIYEFSFLKFQRHMKPSKAQYR